MSRLRRYLSLAREAAQTIQYLNAQLQMRDTALRRAAKEIAEWQDLTLHTTQRAYDTALAWRISQEIPEDDIREEIDSIISEWRDQLARLQEMVVT